jgi:hypothetical protein
MRLQALKSGNEDGVREADAQERAAFAALKGSAGADLDMVVEWQTALSEVAAIEEKTNAFLLRGFAEELNALGYSTEDDIENKEHLEALALAVEKNLVEAWGIADAKLQDSKWDRLAPEQGKMRDALRRYSAKRIKGFLALAESIRTNDDEKGKEAMKLLEESNAEVAQE